MSKQLNYILSSNDTILLKDYIVPLRELAEGQRGAKTSDQARFVKVVKGEIPATTAIEKAYLNFQLLSLEKQDEFINKFYKRRSKKITKKPKVKKIKHSNKKMSAKEKYIDDTHKVSGFNYIRAHFVRG